MPAKRADSAGIISEHFLTKFARGIANSCFSNIWVICGKLSS